MIFDIREEENAVYLVEPPNSLGCEAWECLELLRDAFPSTKYYIACYAGYENAIEISKL